MQRILVTGATGFLGGAVARALHEQGACVVATGRDIRKGGDLARRGLTFHGCDLATNASDVAHLIERCDAVVHCVRCALDHVDKARVTLNPDCGFAPGSGAVVDMDEVYRKLQIEAQAAGRLRDIFGG